jgi:hypothetical protein
VRMSSHYKNHHPEPDGVCWKPSAAHEATQLLKMVRTGLLTADQARALILITDREATNLRKLLEPLTANVALGFRRDVLRLFNAIVQPARTRGRREQRR